MQVLLIVVGAVVAVGLMYAVLLRPQWGLLLMAALAPFNGLLQIPPLNQIPNGWKEGLLAFTLLCAIGRRVRPSGRRTAPVDMPWWPAMALLVAFGVVSALMVYGPAGMVAIKVTYFYLFILLVLWLAPFDRRDRDHLVSIMMGVGALTVAVGIFQQIVGPAALVDMGYEFGKQVRTSGPLLRTFSTFNQPFGFGLYVMVALLVGGAVALADPTRRRNRIFLFFWPVMALTMATSVVRAAILGLAIGVIWLAVQRFRFLLMPLVGVGAALVAALPFLPSSVTTVFSSSSSLGQRSAGWGDMIGSILVHPLGAGLGSSGAAADRMDANRGQATTQTVTASADGTVQGMSANYQPDNYYIKTLLELGPLGLWLFLAMIITALVWCTRSARRLPDPDAAFVAGVGASIVAAMVASLVATYFEIFPLDMYFWLLLGAVGCATAQHNSRTERWHSDPVEVGSRPTSGNSSRLYRAT